MTRLLSTIWLDFRLQLRNNLYIFAAITAVFFIALLRWIIPSEQLSVALPFIFFFAVVATAYMFTGAILLLEKGQGTLNAQVITPLRVHEYLLSKALTVAVLAFVESIAITLFVYGTGFRVIPLVAGLLLNGMFFSFYAFVVAVRYERVTDWIIISVLWLTLLGLPAFHFIGLWKFPLLYAIPTYGPLLLIGAGFRELATWQLIYAVLMSILAVGGVYWWAVRAFNHYVIEG